MHKSNEIFDIQILTKLGNLHKKLMDNLNYLINTFIYDKDIYDYINNYILDNNLKKAFPIGISINQIIAHDSYHELNLKKLKHGDFIKIDVGFIENNNIIDSARTYVYGLNDIEKPQCIIDCENIFHSVEKFIEKQIEQEGKISIQKISAITYAYIVSKGYDALDFLGGHTIEYGKVHGQHYILNKPLKLLPIDAKLFIDSTAEIGEEEMFAIEIYISEKKSPGTMIKSSQIPITHYQIEDKNELDKIKLNKNENKVITQILNLTNNLAYDYTLHKQFDKKIIKKLIDIGAIIKHDPLEFKSNSKEKIKFIQYEDCFLIRNKKLINLTK